MNKSKIYMLDIDDKLDLKYQELQKQFVSGEKIVSTAVHEGRLVITTEVVVGGRPKNLLLEEIDAGKIPASILGLKD